MSTDDSTAQRGVASLKTRLREAKVEITITIQAADDRLISELLGQIGGHVKNAGLTRSLTVSGEAAAALVALGCGLSGVYQPTRSPLTIKPRS